MNYTKIVLHVQGPASCGDRTSTGFRGSPGPPQVSDQAHDEGIWLRGHFQTRRVPEDSLWEKQKHCRVAGRGRWRSRDQGWFHGWSTTQTQEGPRGRGGGNRWYSSVRCQQSDFLDPNSFFSANLREFYTWFFPRLSQLSSPQNKVPSLKLPLLGVEVSVCGCLKRS